MKKPKIVIIGAGISGLVAAYRISQSGANCVLFFPKSELGGLASTFKLGNVDLEKYYHHAFISDKNFVQLAKELEIDHLVQYKKTVSGILDNDRTYPISPWQYIKIPGISLPNKIYSGIKTAILAKKDWHKLKQHSVSQFLPRYIGNQAYQNIWQPVLRKKFGIYSDEIMMPWFTSRLQVRSTKLGYIKGSYSQLFDKLLLKYQEFGGQVVFSRVTDILQDGPDFTLLCDGSKFHFTKVLAAIPPPSFNKITKNLSFPISGNYLTAPYLSVVCLVLVLKKQLSGYYWLNINEKKYPFLAVIEHTNFRSPEEYGGKHVIYLSIYCSSTDNAYHYSKKQLLDISLPLLKNINKNFRSNWIVDYYRFSSEYAQHIPNESYYKNPPKIKTNTKNLFHISLAHIYPYDRGIEKGIELGNRAAKEILHS